MTAERTERPVNPCGRDCPDRTVGCAAGCEKWAAYTQKRAQDYERRKARGELSDDLNRLSIQRTNRGKRR